MQKTKKVVCLLGAVMLAAGMMALPSRERGLK